MDSDNKEYFKGLLAGIVTALLCVCTIYMGVKVYDKYTGKTSSRELDSELGNGFSNKLGVLKSYIDKYYMDDVDEEELQDGIYKGIFESLGDKYSVYYTPEEYKQVKNSNNGEYYGIGVGVNQEGTTGPIRITKVYDDSPAKDAGVEVGDILVEVDGKNISGMEVSTVIADIKGKKDSEVGIKVKRNNQELTFSINRANIPVETIAYTMLDDGIGYLYIGGFENNTAKQVKAAIEDMQSQDMKSIVVDLRDNPGGGLTSVTDISDMFLPKDKVILYTEDKQKNRTEYKTKTDGIIPDMPMVVIVNGNSASASEVFTGTMKNYERATIVGTQTFGKGIMQTLFALNDGSALKVTVGKYYLPDGSNIHGVGIEPNEVVELPEGVKDWTKLQIQEDVQLQKALEVLKKNG